ASVGNLTATELSSTPTTEHTVTLSGLTADTTYYYAIGTSAQILAGDDADHFFVTAPLTGVSKPTRIWVLGDSGGATPFAPLVRDAYQTYTGPTHTDLWLMLGDNAYPDGTDLEYQNRLFDIFSEMLRKSVLWPTLGNHDGVSATSLTQSGPYYDIFSLPTIAESGGVASGTEAYYSFDYGNIHFVVLESHETSRLPIGPMAIWLAQDLSQNTQDWTIAYWHHPPYSRGHHDSDSSLRQIEMRTNFVPILEDYGVDLVLSGHSHNYERSFLLDGHYGDSGTFDESMKLDGGDGRVGSDGAYEK
ncbi:MAG: metallophosphoesterase family protein, partial [Actinomycetia bacterium]|nr:metallophosphoesterase family protein [Actinomycetes bacterium]